MHNDHLALFLFTMYNSMDRLERKLSEQNVGAPPSYEEAVSKSPVHNERYEFNKRLLILKIFVTISL